MEAAAAGQVAAVEVESISRFYPGVTALEDVSVAIHPGETVGLVGHNGAGKSTLTRILGGVERPDRGRVVVGGDETSFGSPDDAIMAGISVVPQQLSVVPLLTVEENIRIGTGARVPGGRAKVREIAAQLGIDGFLNRKVRDSRPSIQRLVMIARALLGSPRVLLLDEPTAALHPTEVDLVFEVVDSLRRQGMAFVFISHRLEEVLAQTSRVVVMRQGRVVAERPSDSIDKQELGALIVGREVEVGRRPEAAGATAADEEPLLVVDDVSCPPRLKRVSLAARPGEVLGIAGLNGSGRSDLLRAIAGVQPIASGSITVGGSSIGVGRRAAIGAGVAYLPGDRVHNGVIPEMTVAATVTLGDDRRSRVAPRVPLLRSRREETLVNGVLAELDLHPRGAAGGKMKNLSGGNQQKALMARALLSGARVYLFDEPTEGVDIGARADLHGEIRKLAAKGAAVMVASSESDELVELADRVVVLYDGEIRAELAREEVSEASVTQAALVG